MRDGIRRDDLTHPSVRALLELHLRGMHANSPPGSVFALDLSGLQSADVTVWTRWIDGEAVGIGALKRLAPGHGEIKSMRTHPDHLRKGVADGLLQHILQEVRLMGLDRVSLETGSGPAFDPALALYRRRGFANGGAFGDYESGPFNQFLHLDLGHA
jgi:putative acetyltransferase